MCIITIRLWRGNYGYDVSYDLHAPNLLSMRDEIVREANKNVNLQ